MSEWNPMTFEGKDTILRVVREQAASMFTMIDDPATWEAPTPPRDTSVRSPRLVGRARRLRHTG